MSLYLRNSPGSLQATLAVLERDMKRNADVGSVSRHVTSDESVEVTLNDGRDTRGDHRVTIHVDSERALDMEYRGYNALKNAIMCDRPLEYLMRSKNVII